MHDDELILVKLRIHKSQYPELHHSIANIDKRKRATIVKRLAENGATVTYGRLSESGPKDENFIKSEQKSGKTSDIKDNDAKTGDLKISFDPELLTRSD